MTRNKILRFILERNGNKNLIDDLLDTANERINDKNERAIIESLENKIMASARVTKQEIEIYKFNGILLPFGSNDEDREQLESSLNNLISLGGLKDKRRDPEISDREILEHLSLDIEYIFNILTMYGNFKTIDPSNNLETYKKIKRLLYTIFDLGIIDNMIRLLSDMLGCNIDDGMRDQLYNWINDIALKDFKVGFDLASLMIGSGEIYESLPNNFEPSMD